MLMSWCLRPTGKKFRGYKKFDNQTYVQFAREKETLFDRWCDSKEISDDYVKLRELMLIEEFKRCIPVELRTYIDEQKASELHDAAVLADEYALTHKDVSKNKHSFSPKKFDSAKSSTNVPDKDKTDQTSSDSHSKTSSHSQSTSSNKSISSNKTCAYCKKPGHLISECYKLKKQIISQQSDLALVRPIVGFW